MTMQQVKNINKTDKHIHSQVIMTITAIKTTPPTVTPQIRPTKNTNVELRVPDNE